MTAAGVWWSAARPATLWAAVGPVAVGTGVAVGAGCWQLLPALAALWGAVWLQIGTNFANDLFDHQKGADGEDRLGPRRAVSSGAVAPNRMAWATVLAFALATAAGVYLVWVAGWWIVVLGVASIAAGVLYTAGPLPLAYVGAGDLFVLLFFGFAAVAGTAAVQCSRPPAEAWIAGLAVGVLNVAILVVNNLRDREGDARAGKRTLVVRLGPRFGRVEYTLLLVVGYASTLWLYLAVESAWLLLPWVTLPLSLVLASRIWGLDGAKLNPLLGQTARLVLVFSLLLAIGLAAA